MNVDYVICVRADSPPFVDGSTFDRRCSRCDARVALAPDTRLVMTQMAIPILCLNCFNAEIMGAVE